uniref:Carboxypeptidase n=1 Tax=Graphocephala atropunctata TaxID=36148 RepID=A0A1B6KZ16_9HEMI
MEVGPFKYQDDKLQKRENSWNLENNLLIIDQPVGTGYSFTVKNCYARNETDVGDDLYKALIQFYQLFPKLVNNKFFISGQSYAGHYIPALGHIIHKQNPTAPVKINLAAMMIGNGLVDPETQLDYGDFYYYLGLIDDAARDVFNLNYQQFVQEVKVKNWVAAGKICNAFRGTLYDRFVDRKVYAYNYARKQPEPPRSLSIYIQSAELRKALHIGMLPFNRIIKVYGYLRDDIVQSVKPWVEELLEFYPIVFYNGQLDLTVGYPMTIKFLRSLNWSGEKQYLTSERTKWCVGSDLAGYYKGAHNLYDVMVRNAGHVVPTDQPLWAYTLMKSVTSGTPDNPLHALTPCE